MATRKALYGISGCKDVFMTDRAVVLEAFLSAYMRCKRLRHASIAVHAVEVVDPQPFANTAQVAIWAMIDFSVCNMTELVSFCC